MVKSALSKNIYTKFIEYLQKNLVLIIELKQMDEEIIFLLILS